MENNRMFSPERLIVQFQFRTTSKQMREILTNVGINPDLGKFDELTSTWNLKVEKGKELALAEELSKNPLVKRAEPNYW